MKKINFKDWLIEKDACSDAVEWVGEKSEAQAWSKCQRADWMIWCLGKMSGTPGFPDINRIVLLACWCARRSLKYIPDGEDRPRLAIEAAERCAKNPTTKNKSAAWSTSWSAKSVAEATARSIKAAADSVAWSTEATARSVKTAAWSAEHKIMVDYIRKTIRLKFKKENQRGNNHV